MAKTGSGTAGGDRRELLKGLARAFGGAIIFALPMLMTMEMWQLGLYMDPLRLALLLAISVPFLIGLSHFGGLRRTRRLLDDVADALVTVLIAAVAAVVVLGAFGVLEPGMSLREVVGIISLQIVPGAIGAALARSQLGGHLDVDEAEEAGSRYVGELFLMGAGALFLGLNVAPTEEMILIAFKMTPWHQIVLVVLSVALMHGFVYGLGFAGTEAPEEEETAFGLFARFTLVGYALVLLLSLYVLWTFGRLDGLSLDQVASVAIVLGFPGAIGAAAARLLL